MAKRRGRPRKSRVTVTAAPWHGDWGTGTKAARANTELVEVTDADGRNPNRMKRRQRVNQLQALMDRGALTMRQWQAGEAIQIAFGRVEMLSSGGELKEQVDASPKPDATIAGQVDAMSRLAHVMRPVLQSDRAIVEHVCWHNKPLAHLARRGVKRPKPRLVAALERVADFLRF